MTRLSFDHDELTFSYLDWGGEGPPLVALHAHWMEGITFAPLAEALVAEWRVIALDQRGHGYSDHANTYTRENYLGDIEALLGHLGLREVVLLGNSLGGVNAYGFAARYPKRVRALIIEDIGVEISADLPPTLGWAGIFENRQELEERIGLRLLPYLRDSFRAVPGGWSLAFDPREMICSQAALAGDHWGDWLATDCPVLLIRGAESRVTTPAHTIQMAHRRPNTKICTLRGGHVVHKDDAVAFAGAVRSFLKPFT